ncbi:response regulator [Pontimicrobium sp. MEBiC06410]|jgi:DNA-binding NarL/FixJ family response regulator
MKNQKYSVLIVDDHPMITEVYKNVLHSINDQNKDISFDVNIAHNCDDAYSIIRNSHKFSKNINLIFLDISLPSSRDGKILSGEDLGLKINSLLPNSKVIISTAYGNNYRIHSILKNLNPDGFLIKSDIDHNELETAVKNVLGGSTYYSKTVSSQIRKEVSNNLLLDNIDRKLLYELSINTKMKDLPNILPLSLAGIEKRKRNLKRTFDVKSVNNDKELITKAKEMGFI